MNIQKIEDNVSRVSIPTKPDTNFVFDVLEAYGKPKSSITRLKLGTYNLSKNPNEVFWKKTIFFRVVEHEYLHSTIDDLRGNKDILRHEPRFIIVTDFDQLLAVDTKTQETLDIKTKELAKHFTFFLPWAGMEKASSKTENLADIKAAGRMAKLYDEIRKENPSVEPEFIHSLNVFFSRLLFCFFAEDTDVFRKGQFTNGIASHTQTDASDLNSYLDRLFESLDKEDKSDYPSHLKEFPYVNGGLFGKKMSAPKFNAQARRILLECGELNWSQINPDIFGSMIQAVVHPSQRESLGMHYTSVVNIMKVIEPLFLEELNEEFDKANNDEKKLYKLLNRIYKLKVFDPACGSGNFLIIAYKELRRLEHRILEQLMKTKLRVKLSSGIKLENFYGVEIDDFAHEIAILSLWLAKHQMNQEFKELFNVSIPLVPLKDAGYIVCANAALVDWEEVCPASETDEIYLIGNPPYLGTRNQEKEHKEDMAAVLGSINYKILDYIAIWFFKGSRYIGNHSGIKLAFVSTNSICQGDQVAVFWPSILNNLEIGFAHQSFKWTNNAVKNAGVTVIVLSLQIASNAPKKLYIGKVVQSVSSINPYLSAGPVVYVGRRSKPISNLPIMSYGNYTGGCESLMLLPPEKDDLLAKSPSAKKFIRRMIGSAELNKGIERYCIWIKDKELDEAMAMPEIARRIEIVRETRLKSKDPSMHKLANRPHQFRDFKTAEKQSLIVPIVFSERRDYIPCDFLDAEIIIPNSAQAIYDPDVYIFGLLSSRMHMSWVRTVSGRLKTDIRYSSALTYNNFPVPLITEKQKEMIRTHVFEVLNARENHPHVTLGDLYIAEKMPGDLLTAHKDLDEVIDRIYRSKPFEGDEDRLQHLFKMYEELTADKKEQIYA